MPANYSDRKKTTKKRAASATRKPVVSNKPRLSRLHWITLILSVLLILFLSYLNSLTPINNETIAKKKQNPVKKEEQKKVKPAREYDFYTILPDIEIEVSHGIKQQNTIGPILVETKKPMNVSAKDNSEKLYQLQISAFKDQNKAETLRAQLGMMGVQSNISQRKLNNGEMIYRVRIGPTKDKDNLLKIRKILEQKNFHPFLQESR